MQYDYLIVGSGLWASTFAYEANKRGHKCLVIEKRSHIAGNIYTENIEGINVHKYGPHIFHTNDKSIWNFINLFADFNHYRHTVVANYKDKLYNLPFNMNTFYQLWKVKTPREAQEKIKQQIEHLNIDEPQNLEEQALKLVGTDVYEKLIKGYTEKQWSKNCRDLPAFIIKRLPVRFTFDNNYFNDKYQGIPIGGYTSIIDKMLNGIEYKVNTNYFTDINYWQSVAKKIVFTGKIDEYFNYQFGELEYRTLHFEEQKLEFENYQGCTQLNYTDIEVPYTRIVEHKHFEFGTQPTTIITKEFPAVWQKNSEPYYPINDDKNQALHKQYQQLAQQQINTIFGGRLAEYKYYDMHQIIASALLAVKKEFN